MDLYALGGKGVLDKFEYAKEINCGNKKYGYK